MPVYSCVPSCRALQKLTQALLHSNIRVLKAAGQFYPSLNMCWFILSLTALFRVWIVEWQLR